jgi:hypothetical protein
VVYLALVYFRGHGRAPKGRATSLPPSKPGSTTRPVRGPVDGGQGYIREVSERDRLVSMSRLHGERRIAVRTQGGKGLGVDAAR